jgi:hypothetical protein
MSRTRWSGFCLRDPAVINFTIHIDSITAGGNVDVLLQSSVKEPHVSGELDGVEVTVPPNSQDGTFYKEFIYFNPDANPHTGLDVGVFGDTPSTIASTYDFRLRDNNLNPTTQPGITAGNNIIVTAAHPLPTDPTINVLAITKLTGGNFPEPSPTDQHHINVLTNGSITIMEKTGDLRVGRIMSTNSDVTLYSPQAIIDALTRGPGMDANVTGINISMTADNNNLGDPATGLGGIGTPGNFLEINVNVNNGQSHSVGVLTAIDNFAATDTWDRSTTPPPFDPAMPGTWGIFLTQVIPGTETMQLLGSQPPSDLEVGMVNTKGDVTLATQNSSIVDGRNNGAGADSSNVIGNTINLYAKGGNIGTAPTSNVYVGGTNQGVNNDLEIESQAYVAGGTIGARADKSIYLTEVGGSVMHAASDAKVVLMQAVNGSVRFTIRDSNQNSMGVSSDLNLLANGFVLFLENLVETIVHGLINAVTGSITLRVGDNVTTDPNAQILAGKNIDIFGDFQRKNETAAACPRLTRAIRALARSCTCTASSPMGLKRAVISPAFSATMSTTSSSSIRHLR